MARLPAHLAALVRAPRHVGPPPGGHDLQGRAVNAACGDVLLVYLALEAGAVSAAGFKAQGCPASMATASAACDVLAGMAADATLPEGFRARFAAAHGEPAAAHRHAVALVAAALADALAG